MNCPTLEELPRPSDDRTGWPWTNETTPLPARMSDGRAWPRVTIVTPSYNQGPFIEETIRSVLLQGYPNLEYIIVDGGSTDCSVDMILKYEKWLAFWVSEPDDGPEYAINKGFQAATGDIVGWLSTDDTYEPEALGVAAYEFVSRPEVIFVYGVCNVIDSESRLIGRKISGPLDIKRLLSGVYFGQPTAFIQRASLCKVGYLNERILASDWELWLRLYFSALGKGSYIPRPLANYRHWPGSNSLKHHAQYNKDQIEVLKQLATKDFFPQQITSYLSEALALHLLQAAQMHGLTGSWKRALQAYVQALVRSPSGFWKWHLRRLISELPKPMQQFVFAAKHYLRDGRAKNRRLYGNKHRFG